MVRRKCWKSLFSSVKSLCVFKIRNHMYSKISVIYNGSLQSQLRFFWKNLLALNDVISCTVHFGCVVCSKLRHCKVPSCDMDGHFIRKKVRLCLRFQCNRSPLWLGGMAASDRHGNRSRKLQDDIFNSKKAWNSGRTAPTSTQEDPAKDPQWVFLELLMPHSLKYVPKPPS